MGQDIQDGPERAKQTRQRANQVISDGAGTWPALALLSLCQRSARIYKETYL